MLEILYPFFLLFQFSVAIGAAIQAAALKRESRAPQVLVRNVIPLSLGICAANKRVNHILKRNTPYPTQTMRKCTNHRENQNEYSIPIFEGENVNPSRDQHLGTLKFESTVPAGKKSSARVDVYFKVKSNGQLTVEAKDAFGNANKLDIHRPNQFENDLIRNMKDEILSLIKIDDEFEKKGKKLKFDKKKIDFDKILAQNKDINVSNETVDTIDSNLVEEIALGE